MNAYIYNTDTMEVVAIINGETNEQCEDKASENGFMGVDEYGLCYSPNELEITNDTIEF